MEHFQFGHVCCIWSLLFLITILTIHQPYDRCYESPSVFQTYSQFRPHCNSIGIGIDISISINIANCLIEYLDSDWPNNSVDHKSPGGHVSLSYNWASSWQSWRQSLLPMRTPKAKWIACLEAPREVKLLLLLQEYIHCAQNDSSPLPIICNKQGALTGITTELINAQTKQIDIFFHNSWDLHW